MSQKKDNHFEHARIDEKTNFRSDQIFREKTNRRISSKNFSIIIIFMSTSKILLKTSFFSFDIATSSIKSDFSISSTRNALKKHFELRYRLDFLNSLNLLIMSCMKNVIDFNQILKYRSYKKIMKNFNRDK